MIKKHTTTRATALFSAVTFESPLKELTARRLSPADVTQAVALTAEAGWNQIDADWRMMLELGDGLGLFTSDGKLVATAIVQPYAEPVPAGSQKFGWISMVLVTPAWQRRGLARWMLELCIAALQGAGYMPMLDATPAGREVYRKLGFVQGLEIERLERKGLPPLAAHAYGPLSADRVADAARFDQACFAADRSDLIASLHARALPAFIAERQGKTDGIALMRSGQRAFHLGPVQAADVYIANGLVQSFATHIGARPVFIDAFAHQTVFVDALKDAGFVLQRKLTRMHLGAKAPDVMKDRYFAIAGPELG